MLIGILGNALCPPCSFTGADQLTPNYLPTGIAIYKTTAADANQRHCSSYEAPGLHSVVLFKVAKAHDHLANYKNCFGGFLCKPLSIGSW